MQRARHNCFIAVSFNFSTLQLFHFVPLSAIFLSFSLVFTVSNQFYVQRMAFSLLDILVKHDHMWQIYKRQCWRNKRLVDTQNNCILLQTEKGQWCNKLLILKKLQLISKSKYLIAYLSSLHFPFDYSMKQIQAPYLNIFSLTKRVTMFRAPFIFNLWLGNYCRCMPANK